jgi:inner membrane protein
MLKGFLEVWRSLPIKQEACMATFITHPLFGAGAAYAVGQSRQQTRKFVVLSALCQWLPDIDVLSYVVALPEQQPLGHRGMMHSLVFASLIALAVLRYGYRELRVASPGWWTMYAWFFVLTALHGVFDAMVADSLGVAFFWPFDSTRYHLPWQPFFDVPITAAELLGGQFWYAVFVESQFCSLMLSGLFVLMRLAETWGMRQPAQVLPPMQTLAADQ